MKMPIYAKDIIFTKYNIKKGNKANNLDFYLTPKSGWFVLLYHGWDVCPKMGPFH